MDQVNQEIKFIHPQLLVRSSSLVVPKDLLELWEQSRVLWDGGARLDVIVEELKKDGGREMGDLLADYLIVILKDSQSDFM